MAIDVDTEAPETAEPTDTPAFELPFHRPTIRETFADAWHSRHTLRYLGSEAIRRSFYLTFLGPTWIFLNAAMDIGGKTFLFGGVLDVQTPHGVPYFIFLLTGMLGWTLFSQTLNVGVRSFQRYRRYAIRFHMPLVLLPMGAGAGALLQFCIYLCVVLAALVYYALRGVSYWASGAQILFVPYGLVLCLLFAWGLSLILAPINYRVRDVHQVLRYVLQFWLYVTPVVYPLTNLHGTILLIAKLNPLAPMTEMIKYGLIGGGNIGVQFVAWGTGVAFATFALGIVVMNRIGHQTIARPLISIDDDEDDEL